MAHFSNKFGIVDYGDVVRVMFKDCIEDQDGVIQTQVVMRATDAEQLAESILELRKKRREGRGTDTGG